MNYKEHLKRLLKNEEFRKYYEEAKVELDREFKNSNNSNKFNISK